MPTAVGLPPLSELADPHEQPTAAAAHPYYPPQSGVRALEERKSVEFEIDPAAVLRAAAPPQDLVDLAHGLDEGDDTDPEVFPGLTTPTESALWSEGSEGDAEDTVESEVTPRHGQKRTDAVLEGMEPPTPVRTPAFRSFRPTLAPKGEQNGAAKSADSASQRAPMKAAEADSEAASSRLSSLAPPTERAERAPTLPPLLDSTGAEAETPRRTAAESPRSAPARALAAIAPKLPDPLESGTEPLVALAEPRRRSTTDTLKLPKARDARRQRHTHRAVLAAALLLAPLIVAGAWWLREGARQAARDASISSLAGASSMATSAAIPDPRPVIPGADDESTPAFPRDAFIPSRLPAHPALPPAQARRQAQALLAQAEAAQSHSGRLDFLRSAMLSDPRFAPAAAALARAHRHEPELAVLWARHAAQLQPRRASYQALLAETLRAAGDEDDATRAETKRR